MRASPPNEKRNSEWRFSLRTANRLFHKIGSHWCCGSDKEPICDFHWEPILWYSLLDGTTAERRPTISKAVLSACCCLEKRWKRNKWHFSKAHHLNVRRVSTIVHTSDPASLNLNRASFEYLHVKLCETDVRSSKQMESSNTYSKDVYPRLSSVPLTLLHDGSSTTSWNLSLKSTFVKSTTLSWSTWYVQDTSAVVLFTCLTSGATWEKNDAGELIFWLLPYICTGWLFRIQHRKWRDTKLQPSSLPGLALLDCSLVSLYFRCWILRSHPVQFSCEVLKVWVCRAV